MLSSVDIAFAAGFIEGEGSFCATGAYRRNPAVAVSQVQREPLERMLKWFGGSICYVDSSHKKNPTHQPYYKWQVTGKRAAGLMMTIFTLMSPRRKDQMEAVLDAWKSPHLITSGEINKAKTHCKKGHEYAGDNLYVYPDGRRDCKTCVKVSREKYTARKRLIQSI